MNGQAVTFAVETKDGVVNRIGKSFITTPEIKFRGGEIKWYQDKYKVGYSKKGDKQA